MTEVQNKEIKLIVFQLKDKEYAFPVSQVRSIEKIINITRVPGAPSFVKGVINLRGVITPIIDLRSRFGIEESDFTANTRLIITSHEDNEIGFIADAANDVLDIPENLIESPPEVIGGIETNYINGVANLGNRLLILLDLNEILSEDNAMLRDGFLKGITHDVH